MEFRVLGPLEVVDGDGPIHLGGPKQRAVLAHLLVRANRVVSTDELTDALWGEALPDLPRASIHTYVSNLRKALGAERIENRAPGYVLLVTPDEVDALLFEQLLRDGARRLPTEQDQALSALETALKLWRGGAYADLTDDPRLRAEAARLAQLKLEAIERRIEATMALGRHAEVVDELETLTSEHPTRERFWEQRLLALYRSGRQGDALTTYLLAREIIADELGVDPSPQLQRLHLRILKQDPTLELQGRPLRGYQLLEEVGRGAFGVVYRALQPEVGREVAVKVVDESLASDPDFIRRFEHEAQLVARLEHPNIVPLYDYWRDPGGAYLVMRYLKGGNLAQLIRDRGPLSLQETTHIVDDLARALAFAHQSGVVHRDVRPQNVLFDQVGNAFLSDFGIAKALAAGKDLAALSPGLAYYLAPEEIQGMPLTAATDVYSLGLLVFEILAGRHAFADSPPADLPDRHLTGSIPPLPGDQPRLDVVIRQAAARDPADRFDDAMAFARALREALQSEEVSVAPPVIDIRNPYKGLRPFQEPDAPDFFGREAVVDRIVAHLSEVGPGHRFLALVGPSGSGKSSLLRAGVIPALRKGAVPGSERWFVVDMHPGAHPFEELESALMSIAGERPAGLLGELTRDDKGLTRAVASLLPADGSELLVLVDQFEELFTLVVDDERRLAFLDCMREATANPESRIRIVVTMRADFYDRPLLYRAFGDLLANRTVALTPMSVDELERVITVPAASVGVNVEPALVAEILTAVADQPVLPLLQYALTELLDSRENATLTLKAYHQVGGVVGALSRRADEVYAALEPSQQQATRQLFLRLLTVGEEGMPETRRRVQHSELGDLELDPAGMDRVIDLFGAHRLLSFDRDPVTRGPTVEVAHEALLREWGRLRGWIESAREDLRTHRRVAAAAQEWQGSGDEASFLLTGARLDQVESWASTSSIVLSSAERRFVAASSARREVERNAERVRRAREVALEARSRTRLRALVAVFAVAAVVASALSALALNERGVALRQARAATARELAAAALANIPIDPQRSLILALKAVNTTRGPDGIVVPEAESVLHRAVVASRVEETIRGAGTMFSWSRATNTIAFAGMEDLARIAIRDPSGDIVRSWAAPKPIQAISFLTAGRLATSDERGVISIWDSATGTLSSELKGPPGPAYGLSASSDGRLVAGLWWDDVKRSSSARVWDLRTGRNMLVIDHLEGPPHESAQGTALSPDGTRIAVALGWESVVEVYDVRTGRLQHSLQAGVVFQINRLAWTSDGNRLASVGQEMARVWDVSGTLVATLVGHAAAVSDVAWSPDDSVLATASDDGTVRLWKAEYGFVQPPTVLAGHDVGLTGVAFNPSGDRVLSTGVDGTANIWNVGLGGDAEWMNLPTDPIWFNDVAYSRDGTRLIGADPGGKVTIWDAATGKAITTIAGHGLPPGHSEPASVASIAVSPNGSLIATGGRDTRTKLWRADTGELLWTFTGHTDWVEEVRFSADGRFLSSTSWDSTARVIDVATGKELHQFRHDKNTGVASAWFGAGDQTLVTAGSDHTIRVWDLKTEQPLMKVEVGRDGNAQITSIAVNRKGTLVAAATRGGKAFMFDLRSGKLLATLSGHSAAIHAIAFSPDEQEIATASDDGEIHLWNVQTFTSTLTLLGHASPIGAIVFSPDGKRLASTGNDGKIRVWALDIGDLIRIAERKVTRSLTPAECLQYLHVARC